MTRQTYGFWMSADLADINTQIYLCRYFLRNWSSDGYLDGIELHVGDDSSSGKQSLMKLEDFSDLTFNMLQREIFTPNSWEKLILEQTYKPSCLVVKVVPENNDSSH